MKLPITAQTLRERNTPFTWLILVAAFIFFIPSLMMDKLWISVESVEVANSTPLGEPIIMNVEREVLNSFRGYFTVDVRRIDGELVCTGKPTAPFNYETDKQLPEPLLLTWWIGGQFEMDSCRNRGFHEGLFYIDTCHTKVVSVWDIPFARRCIKSNIFQIDGGIL